MGLNGLRSQLCWCVDCVDMRRRIILEMGVPCKEKQHVEEWLPVSCLIIYLLKLQCGRNEENELVNYLTNKHDNIVQRPSFPTG